MEPTYFENKGYCVIYGPYFFVKLGYNDHITSTPQQALATFLDNLFGSGYKNYVNSSYHVKIDYPNDWHYEEAGHDELFPQTIFKVHFFSPINTQEIVAGNDLTVIVSVSIDELKPSVTLDQYKDRIMNNLKSSTNSVKDVTISASTLGGEQAYRIEHMIWLIEHWGKSITIYAVKDGKLHEFSALGKSEALEK